YPLYLVHSQLALPLLDALYPAVDRWTALAVVVTASLLSAHAVHRLIERPAAAWMRPRLRASLAAASPRPEATEAAVRLNGDRSRPCRPRPGRRRAGPARPRAGRGGGRAGRRRRALKEKNVPSKKYVLREGRGRARPDTLPGPPRLSGRRSAISSRRRVRPAAPEPRPAGAVPRCSRRPSGASLPTRRRSTGPCAPAEASTRGW